MYGTIMTPNEVGVPKRSSITWSGALRAVVVVVAVVHSEVVLLYLLDKTLYQLP